MSLQTLYSNYKWLSDNVIERIIEIEIFNRISDIDELITSVQNSDYPSYPHRDIEQRLANLERKFSNYIKLESQERDKDNRISKLESEVDRLKKAPSAASVQKEVESLKDANKQLIANIA